MSDAILIKVSVDNGEFIVEDARGQRHVIDRERLGQLVIDLMLDPTMPRVQPEKRSDIVGIVAAVARRVIPRHSDIVDAAEPVGHQLTALTPIVRERLATRRKR